MHCFSFFPVISFSFFLYTLMKTLLSLPGHDTKHGRAGAFYHLSSFLSFIDHTCIVITLSLSSSIFLLLGYIYSLHSISIKGKACLSAFLKHFEPANILLIGFLRIDRRIIKVLPYSDLILCVLNLLRIILNVVLSDITAMPEVRYYWKWVGWGRKTKTKNAHKRNFD